MGAEFGLRSLIFFIFKKSSFNAMHSCRTLISIAMKNFSVGVENIEKNKKWIDL